MTQSGKRAFWMHQAAEYVIAAAFVASGLQSPKPIVPTLMGGLILLNTACSKGPLAAFRVFGKRSHRVLDAALVLLSVVAAVQPAIEIDGGTRGIMLLLAFALAVIWMQSDFSERAPKQRPNRGTPTQTEAPSVTTPRAATISEPDGSTADTIGRTAGRLAGKGVNIYRSRKASQQNKSR